jgi:hypothetical protein
VTGGHWDGRQWQLQWQLFEQKRGWTREKERGDRKMGLFFDAVLFVIVVWFTFFNAGWLFFIKIKSIVGWASLARFLF